MASKKTKAELESAIEKLTSERDGAKATIRALCDNLDRVAAQIVLRGESHTRQFAILADCDIRRSLNLGTIVSETPPHVRLVFHESPESFLASIGRPIGRLE